MNFFNYMLEDSRMVKDAHIGNGQQQSIIKIEKPFEYTRFYKDVEPNIDELYKNFK